MDARHAKLGGLTHLKVSNAPRPEWLYQPGAGLRAGSNTENGTGVGVDGEGPTRDGVNAERPGC